MKPMENKSNSPKSRLSGDKFTNNPRYITKKKFKMLQESLEELGDLSGVVHDLNSNQYISGNQRSEVFQGHNYTLVETFDPPTKTGTVGLGYIVYKNEMYQYRQVRWTTEQTRKANLLANGKFGEWDTESLANYWSDMNLSEYAVDVSWVDAYEKMEKEREKPKGKVEIVHECPECGHKYTV